MPQFPTSLDMTAPTPQGRVQGYNVPQGPNLGPLEQSGNRYTQSVDQMQRAGAGIGEAASGAVNEFVDQRDKDSLVDATNRENAAQSKITDYLYNPDNGVISTQHGQDAIGAGQRTQEFLANLKTQTLDGVSPYAAKHLGPAMDSLMNANQERADQHETSQKDGLIKTVNQGVISTRAAASATNYMDDKLYAQGAADSHTAAWTIAQHELGFSAPMADLQDSVQQSMSSYYKPHLEAMLDSNVPAVIQKGQQQFNMLRQNNLLTAADVVEMNGKFKTAGHEADATMNFQAFHNHGLSASAGASTLSDFAGLPGAPEYQAGIPQSKSPASLPGPVTAQPIDGAPNKGVSGSTLTAADLMNSQVKYESGGKQTGGSGSVAGPNEPTTSSAGAIGIAQVLPSTAQKTAQKHGIQWDEQKFKTDGDYNKQLGTLYLGDQIDHFGDNRLALAAYNAGPGWVDDVMNGTNNSKKNPSLVKVGNDPDKVLAALPQETQGYVSKVMRDVAQHQASNGQGFNQDAVQAWAAKLPPEQKQFALAKVASENQAIAAQDKQNTNAAIDRAKVAQANNGGDPGAISPTDRAFLQKKGLYDLIAGTYGKSDGATMNMLGSMNTEQFSNYDFSNPDAHMMLSAKDMAEMQKKQGDIISDPKNADMSRKIDNAVSYTFGADHVVNPSTKLPYTAEDFSAMTRRQNAVDGTKQADDFDKNNYLAFDQLSRFRTLVGQQVRDQYAATGKAPTDNDVQAIADKLIMNRSVSPAVQNQIVTGSQNAHWYDKIQIPVTKNITDLTVDDVPDDKRRVIESALRQVGTPINDANVLNAYQVTLQRNPKTGYLESTAQVPKK